MAHVENCRRCRGRLAKATNDSERCARLLTGPQLVPDVDLAWSRLLGELRRPSKDRAPGRRDPSVAPGRSRFVKVTMRGGLAAGAVAVVLAGTVAAATVTTVFAPTHVAPVTLNGSDVAELADFMGLGPGFT